MEDIGDSGARMLDRELKKGSAELLILALLEAEDRHCYDISRLIEQRSGGTLNFRVASLYPLLYRLEKRSWIHGKWVEKAGQRRRRDDHLTAQGQKVLASQRRGWQVFVEAIIAQRLTELRLPATRELEIAEELAEHLEDDYQRSLAMGATPPGAVNSALSELSDANLSGEMRGVEKSEIRKAAVLGAPERKNFVADLWLNLRYAARTFSRCPGRPSPYSCWRWESAVTRG